MTRSYDDLAEGAAALARALGDRVPELAIVLGSGWGGVALSATGAVRVPYDDVPGFPRPSVEGHAGEVVGVSIGGVDTLLLSGRTHFYEGRDVCDVVAPVRILKLAGVRSVVLTNAAGGVDPRFAVGDVMAISDHLNLTGENPLRGPNDARLGPRFPDMSAVYDRTLLGAIDRASAGAGIGLWKGVYAGLAGPSYETPAEVRMLRSLGAHAVGMSTVLEAIAAVHCGVRVAGLSCITNAAAGIADSPLSHDEVMATAASASPRLEALLVALCSEIASGDRPETPR